MPATRSLCQAKSPRRHFAHFDNRPESLQMPLESPLPLKVRRAVLAAKRPALKTWEGGKFSRGIHFAVRSGQKNSEPAMPGPARCSTTSSTRIDRSIRRCPRPDCHATRCRLRWSSRGCRARRPPCSGRRKLHRPPHFSLPARSRHRCNASEAGGCRAARADCRRRRQS